MKVYDMHCHVGFAQDIATYCRELDALGIHSLCATVTPSEYESLKNMCEGTASSSIAVTPSLMMTPDVSDSLSLGLGLHPWWVAQGAGVSEIERFERNVEKIIQDRSLRIVAEVGLDYSSRWIESRGAQKEALRKVFEVCDRTNKPWVYSVHCVKADSDFLNMMEEIVKPEHSFVVLHSFNGSCEGLHRALRLGCYFSVGQRFLSSRKGREYLKSIPVDRIMLETDLPSHVNDQVSSQNVIQSLKESALILEAHYGKGAQEIMRQTSEEVLSWAQ